MNKKIRKFLIAAVFSLSILVTGSAIVNMQNPEVLAANTWSEVTFEECYLQGDTLYVPDRTLNVGGTEVTATVTVTLPDGTTTTSKTVTMKLAGQYTVKYTAMVNGRVYSQTETVMAKYATVTYGKDGTSTEYGAHALAPSVEGLKVRLAEDDTLLFNEVIDLNNVTENDVLFEAFATADTIGTVDFKKLFVQFTDVEDSSNYFKVRYIHTQSSTGGPYTYILAGGNGQPMTGWEGGNWNIIHVDNQWGAGVRHSFASDYGANSSEIGKTRLSLRFDAASKCVYNGTTLIIDLDNPKHFSSLWDGFKSGKVRMSVWADDYATNTANFVITKAAGIDLTSDTMEEITPPDITVHTEYTADTMPKAQVGQAYAIPTATAFDAYSGDSAVKASVYYNYLSSMPSNVAISNGTFTPTYAGTYAIVYEAQDYMGNVAKEILWVDALTEISAPVISLTEALVSEVNAGEEVILPGYTVAGGSGACDVKIYVSDGKTEWEVNGAFRPSVVADHTVRYVATDYIGLMGEYTATIKVNKGTAPVFVDKPELPKYMIAGAYYYIPELYAEDYTSGELVRKLATVNVTDANGTKTIAAGEQYIPEVTNNFDTVTITYDVDGVTYSVEIPTVKAKDDDGIYVGNYFDLSGAKLELNDETGLLSATAPNGSWTFANALVAHEVVIGIKADTTKSEFDGIKITFTDSKDESVAISANLYKKGSNSNFVTDVKEFDIEVGFTAQSANTAFEIGYKDNSFLLNGSAIAFKNTVSGEPFTGFPSGKIYVNFEFINATVGKAAYSMVEVNGQKVNSTTIDRVSPKIVILGVRGGTFPIHSNIVLPAAIAGDTLDPNVEFSLTVSTPDLQVVTSVDGLYLENVDPTKEYEISLEAYGQYKVTYTAKDSFSGRKSTLTYAVNVDDASGPMIIFDHAFQTTAKVGELLIIPNFRVEDNVCDADKIGFMKSCLTPTGEIVELYEESNSILTTKAGVYQLRVFAIDEAGNQTLCRVDILVTE